MPKWFEAAGKGFPCCSLRRSALTSFGANFDGNRGNPTKSHPLMTRFTAGKCCFSSRTVDSTIDQFPHDRKRLAQESLPTVPVEMHEKVHRLLPRAAPLSTV